MRTLVLIALTAILSSQALAQDAVLQGITTEQQIRIAEERQQAQIDAVTKEDDAVLPGETGVFILTKREIFSVRAGVQAGFTDNPAKNDLGGPQSEFITGFADIGVDTRIANALNAGARLSFSATRYLEAPDVNNSNAVMTVYLSEDVFEGINLQGVANLGFQFADSIGEETFFASGAVSISRAFILHPRAAVTPFVSVGLHGSETSELRNHSLSAGVSATILGPYGVLLQPSFRWSHVAFPDFFEDVTFVERSDDRFLLSLGAQYRFSDHFVVLANFGYGVNRSTLDLSDFESIDATAAFQFDIAL